MSAKIIAHIPARLGSERVERKNLALLNGKPLISYPIQALSSVKTELDFYVNTESEEIAEMAKSLGSSVYRRPEHLAKGDVVQDHFNYDFIQKMKPDILVLVNPVCPLVTAEDIDGALSAFQENHWDTLVTTTSYQLHTFFEGSPVNFQSDRELAKTQDLKPVKICNWAVCIWDAHKFCEHYESEHYAVFVGNYGFYDIPAQRAVKISTQSDFDYVQKLMN